ncbi:MAG: hypothetical protein IT336_14775 [Thermomicrobiales bacterium]|nr:hypothetical protein [Thermomicrobiales bacterium]
MSDRCRTGPGGFLRDRNGDGFIDDLALRIVLPRDADRIPVEIWRGLIDLAARVGLETAGLPEQLVMGAHDAVPPDCVRLLLLPDGEDGETSEEAVAIRSAHDIERLLADEPQGDASNVPGPAIESLAAIFEPGGLLVDRDDDLLADGSRVRLRLPDPCPAIVGRAAVEFAARIGMESGGIDLPIGLTPSMPAPAESVVIDLAPRPAGDLPPGVARLRVDGDALDVDGDGSGVAALLSVLAAAWPNLRPGGAPETEIGSLLDRLRDLLVAGTAEGRVAALVADLDRVPAGSTLLMRAEEPDELALARQAMRDREVTVEADLDAGRVFALDWEHAWEVDEARDLIGLEIEPLVRRREGERFDLLVAVSEPRDIRLELERELLAGLGEHVGVRVLSAYKLGLSWLREVVIPALSDLGGVDRVEIRYAPFEPAGAESEQLDLRIRWLQELFPGDELIAAALDLPLSDIDLIEGTGGETYEVTAYRAGDVVWRDAISPFSRPLPYVPLDPAKGTVATSTGGVRLVAGAGIVLERIVPTDVDRFWGWFQGEVLPAVAQHIEQATGGAPTPDLQPFFDALDVDVWMSEPDESLGVREELDSAAEALHEDVYFGALDWFAAHGEQRAGAPFDGPGSIVPLIHVRRGAPAARVSLTAKRRFAATAQIEGGTRRGIGSLDGLPMPRLTVSAVAVGPDGLREVDVLVSGGDDRTRRILTAAAQLPGDRADRSVTFAIRSGRGPAIRLERPLPGSALDGASPAARAASDREIVFEGQLPGHLARIAQRPGATVFAADRSFRGRPLWVMELTAPMLTWRWSRAKLSIQKPTLLVAARHHANEVSSTTAAFLLAESLTGGELRPLLDRVNVVIIPFENPDGAALHERLATEHPTWKHHAARYNAVGLEVYFHLVDEETPYGEARVRPAINRRWRPDVIVDNHGVPSHEWSQHFSGFGSPPRFPVSYWMVQALLYGIMRHPSQTEHTRFAERLRGKIAAELRRNPELHERNATYLDRYERWGTSRVPDRFPSEIHDGFLCYMSSAEPDPQSRNLAVRMPKTITLDWVTEVPDETAHGEQLSLTARCQLLSNVMTLELMAESRNEPRRVVARRADGGLSISIERDRPLVV